MSELEASEIGEAPPPYMIFVVVFLFFMTGLSGFMICHLLKKKGYRCRAGDMEEETEEDEKLGANTEDDDEENQDTVEQILKCIIENEANMEAFNEMLGNKKVCVLHDPRMRKESIGGIPPHHHTVHSGTEPGSCHLCAQGRSKKGRRQSRTPRSKLRPGEQTVFAVGRFRVTHADKKLRGGPNQMAGSGDQLDLSQDSEGERKEGGYNLRSMFKDVKPPSENTNGVPPNPGKRRKSLTIFGLRRGSDQTGIKVKESTGREGGAGGVRFAIHKQPVVIEEMVQAEDVVESEAKPSVKLEIEPTKKQTQGSGNATSSQSKDQDSRVVPRDSPSPKSRTNLPKPSAVVSTATSSVPNSLPIPSPATSREKAKLEDRLDAYDPGPLQTSTPIAPIHGSIPGFTPTPQSESYSTTPCPVTQTPPGTPNLQQPGFGGADLALISLGSSPQSYHSIKTPSSVSLLKSPTSPGMAITPSPKISSRYAPSDAAEKSDLSLTPSPRLSSRNSLALTPSPKLPSGRAVSSQSPNPSPSPSFPRSPLQLRSPKLDTMRLSPQTPDQIPSFGNSPRLALKSESVTSVSSRGDIMISSPLTPKEPEPEVARIRVPEAKTEIKPVGILKTAKISPVEGDFKGSAFSSPTDQLSRDSLQVSPSSPMSPSSPIGGRITNVTIVKASPDSKREFSVVTMIDEVESSATNAIKDQKEVTTELGKSEKEEVTISPTVGQGGEVPGNRSVEASAAEVGPPAVSQEKDDMDDMEMEDIKDCKVTEDEDEKL